MQWWFPLLADVPPISLWRLAVAMLPAVAAIALLARWSLKPGEAVYAMGRMLLQLLLIGYALNVIFLASSPWPILLVLLVMVGVAAWTSLRTIGRSRQVLRDAFVALIVGGGSTLLLVTQGVLNLDPWFEPRIVIPLAGMIFASSMNTLSLAADRYASEQQIGSNIVESRTAAMSTALIPTINSLLAVGLVSIPGMMTGQVLSGVDPLIAARYQIMVMAMIFGSATLSAGCFLWLQERS